MRVGGMVGMYVQYRLGQCTVISAGHLRKLVYRCSPDLSLISSTLVR